MSDTGTEQCDTCNSKGSGTCDTCSSKAGAVPSEQQARIERNLSKIKNRIAIVSGKGGVGKSTVTAGIAYNLARKVMSEQLAKEPGMVGPVARGSNVPYDIRSVASYLLYKEIGSKPVVEKAETAGCVA